MSSKAAKHRNPFWYVIAAPHVVPFHWCVELSNLSLWIGAPEELRGEREIGVELSWVVWKKHALSEQLKHEQDPLLLILLLKNSSSHLESPPTTESLIPPSTGQNRSPRSARGNCDRMAAFLLMEHQCPTLLVGPGLPLCDNISCSNLQGFFQILFWWFPKLLKNIVGSGSKQRVIKKGIWALSIAQIPKHSPMTMLVRYSFLKLFELWAAMLV